MELLNLPKMPLARQNMAGGFSMQFVYKIGLAILAGAIIAAAAANALPLLMK
jgi:hypothetical protein